MNLLRLSLMALALCFYTGDFAQAQVNLQGKYNEGVALFNQGKYGEALVVFEEILQVKPDYVYARNYSAKCKLALAQNLGPKNDLEDRLKRIVIPEIKFVEAPLADVMEYFTSRSTELSNGETTVNFIYKGTPEQRANTLITLSLRNVPLSEALKYVGGLSNSRITYEAHAVVIDPGTSGAPAAPTSPNGATTPAKSSSQPLFD